MWLFPCLTLYFTEKRVWGLRLRALGRAASCPSSLAAEDAVTRLYTNLEGLIPWLGLAGAQRGPGDDGECPWSPRAPRSQLGPEAEQSLGDRCFYLRISQRRIASHSPRPG